MRDILFKAKRVDNGEWVYGYYFKATHHWHNHGIHEDWIATDTVQNGGWCNVRGKYAVLPETVGQYTGLTDKNGKKIFEGDIVKHYHDKKFPESYSKGYVFWDEEYLRWKRTSENVNCCIANDCIYEVIGNIHDNPELLEVN